MAIEKHEFIYRGDLQAIGDFHSQCFADCLVAGNITAVYFEAAGVTSFSGDWFFGLNVNGAPVLVGADRPQITAVDLEVEKTGLNIPVLFRDRFSPTVDQRGAGVINGPITVIIFVDDGNPSGGADVDFILTENDNVLVDDPTGNVLTELSPGDDGLGALIESKMDKGAPAGGVLSGNYPNPGLSEDVQASIPGVLPVALDLGFMASMPGSEIIRFRQACVLGNNDIYTVPAGKKLFLSGLLASNTTAGALGRYWAVKRGSNYHRLIQLGTVGSRLSNYSALYLTLEAGEIVAINSDAGMIGSGAGMLLPDNASVKTVLLNGITTVIADLYEVPAGKQAFVYPTAAFGAGISPPGWTANITLSNDSGVSPVAISCFFVPSGQVQAADHLVGRISVFNEGQSTSFAPVIMNAGDKLMCSSDSNTAGQRAWITVYERDI